MSRLSFILGITMLVVAGTVIFAITFERDSGTAQASERRDGTSTRRPVTANHAPQTARPGPGREAGDPLTLDPAATAHLDQSTLTRVNSILSRTENEAREELAKLTRQYNLTPQQQEQVLPYILAHHEQAHPSMTINGQFLPVIAPGTTFEDSLAPLLTPAQQDALIEEALDDEAWWKEIVGQLENDLDAAIENGEMVPAPSVTPAAPVPAEAPAPGDGEASGHGGGNLFDLLGQ